MENMDFINNDTFITTAIWIATKVLRKREKAEEILFKGLFFTGLFF